MWFELTATDTAIATRLCHGDPDLAICRDFGLSAESYGRALGRLDRATRRADDPQADVLCERALRRRADAKVRSLTECFEALADLIQEGVLVVAGRTGVITEANDAAARLFDRPRRQLIGCVVEDLLPESIRPSHEALRLQLISPDSSPLENLSTLVFRPDGSRLRLRMVLSEVPVDEDVLIVCSDRFDDQDPSTSTHSPHESD